MGDRISIQFTDGREESIVLFNHWGGIQFKEAVKEYYKTLPMSKSNSTPLDRGEPNTVMVDFVRWLTKDQKRIESSLYFGKDEFDGDSSDNGHHVFDLNKGKFVNQKEEPNKQVKRAINILEVEGAPNKILSDIKAWLVAREV